MIQKEDAQKPKMYGINIKKVSDRKTWPSPPRPSQSCTLRTCLNPVIPPQPFHFPFTSTYFLSVCRYYQRCIKTHHHQSHLTLFHTPLPRIPSASIRLPQLLCVPFCKPDSALPFISLISRYFAFLVWGVFGLTCAAFALC
ncbi:hypothetical protein GGI35DRAFT_285968 [Trichoderma velutinum]